MEQKGIRQYKDFVSSKKKTIGESRGIVNGRNRALNKEIDKLMDMEECMWNQREKTDWLKYGDQNTKYFYC